MSRRRGITFSGGIHGGPIYSRRQILALTLGGVPLLAGSAATTEPPLRLAISESLSADVNLNDARAALAIWLQRMSVDLNLRVEYNPAIFDTTEDIFRRVRAGQVDAVALNVVEYRQIADALDPKEIVSESGDSGPEQYVLLTKRSSGIQRLPELRGRRLTVLTGPKMCVAPIWLINQMEDAKLGEPAGFFGSVISSAKPSRVVLPVFFGQADACLASKHAFDTMCELNPQLGKDLTMIKSSPSLVVTFYIFRKNYRSVNRERFVNIYANVQGSTAGRQLATLFHFDRLEVRDISCLTPALAILQAADHGHAKP